MCEVVFDRIRTACHRSLSCTHGPLRSETSIEHEVEEDDGNIVFGDPEHGYTLALTFRIPDARARGLNRLYSLLVVSADHTLLLNNHHFLLSALRRIADKMKVVMRICAPAGQSLPAGMFPGAPCRNPTNPTPSFHLVLNGIEDLILCLVYRFDCSITFNLDENVYMREFNSELPTILYKKGYDAIAATLEVGDYVLSPGIIERKALDDLTQSLQSGRGFKQTEQMVANYAAAYLLTGANTKFELKIVNGGPFQGELSRHCREIRQQLCTLIPEHCRSGRRCAVAIRGDEVNEEELATRKSPASPTPPSCVAENLPNFNKAKVQKLMLGGAANLGEIFRGTPEKLVEYLPDDGDTLSLLFNFNFRAQ
ncbi:unnamed protein product, partial [Mesorhabditis spiculigera]